MLVCLVFLISFSSESQHVIVLGTAQDGGFPHIGCQRKECQRAHKDPTLSRYVVSLALVDPKSQKWWLFEATPDLTRQLQYFQDLTNGEYPYLPEGVFLTHAHMGHYTGLMHFGREALGVKEVKVYGLPRMSEYLRTNGPWNQLVKLKNIIIEPISFNKSVNLSEGVSVTAMQVPHRDEYSETAGFKILTEKKDYLFIPDIDKWSKWDKDLIEEVNSVNYAFLDATFFSDGELPNRAMSEVPHPFVSETMDILRNESRLTKGRIHFIHFNHTNPLLFDDSTKIEVLKSGFRLAEQGQIY